MRQIKEKPRVFYTIMKLLGIVLLIVLVLIGLVLLIGWAEMWRTQEEFKNAIQLAGTLVIGVGLLGIKGNWEGTRNFEYQQSMSVLPKSSWERTQQDLMDLAQSYLFTLVTVFAGGICLLIGWLM